MIPHCSLAKTTFAALTLALTACAHQSPPLTETTIPAAWSEHVAAGAPVWPSETWWTEFGSTELDRLMTEARRNNLDLSAAAARLMQAKAQKRIAFAPLLPAVDGGASAQTFSGDRSRTPTSGTTNGRSQSYSIDLTASYELDFWGKNIAGLNAARANYRASQFDQAVVALTVSSNVASTYFQVLSLRERLAIARSNLETAERILAVVDSRVRNGVVTPLDLAQQRSAVAQQQAQIPALAQQELAARAALAVLLGRPPEGFSVESQTLAGLSDPSVAPGLPSELLTRRPDILREEASLQAAGADIWAARAQFFPSISLTGSGGVESAALSGLFGGAGIAATAAASLAQPLFEGGRLWGQYKQTVARREELVSAYRNTVISAFSDVEVALGGRANLAEQERLQQIQVDEARKALDISERQYRAGTVDLLTLLDAQRTLYGALDGLSQSHLARLQASVSLYRALGGGWTGETTAAAAAEPAG